MSEPAEKFVDASYCASYYTVVITDPSGKVYEEYMAGNSPLDSQIYLSPERGIGLEKMREHCESTAREMAAEHGATFHGADECEDEHAALAGEMAAR